MIALLEKQRWFHKILSFKRNIPKLVLQKQIKNQIIKSIMNSIYKVKINQQVYKTNTKFQVEI